ncbi:MAG: aspartate/glutamate racemase family protein [Actinobacteria bacterium]|nr:aspartate/glutamate racemase family protein [Actinomycetota bacterium]
MTTVGLIHTVPQLAGPVEERLRTGLDGSHRIHLADPTLLEQALRDGVTPAVQHAATAHARYLASAGARAILITCSSIGALADPIGTELGIPVQRIDAAMAREAVRLAEHGRLGRIGVLAALDSTLEPTTALLRESRSSERLEIHAGVVSDAARLRAAGEEARADQVIAAAIRDLAPAVDVVVLAQASMAGAARLAEGPVPVLTSLDSGVADFVATVAALGPAAE